MFIISHALACTARRFGRACGIVLRVHTKMHVDYHIKPIVIIVISAFSYLHSGWTVCSLLNAHSKISIAFALVVDAFNQKICNVNAKNAIMLCWEMFSMDFAMPWLWPHVLPPVSIHPSKHLFGIRCNVQCACMYACVGNASRHPNVHSLKCLMWCACGCNLTNYRLSQFKHLFDSIFNV